METDWVSKLQRYSAHNGLWVAYNWKPCGEQHAPSHNITVTMIMANGTELTATGTALKKKDAKQSAAQALWALIPQTSNPDHGHHAPEKDNNPIPHTEPVDEEESCPKLNPTPAATAYYADDADDAVNYVGQLQVRLPYLQMCTWRTFVFFI